MPSRQIKDFTQDTTPAITDLLIKQSAGGSTKSATIQDYLDTVFGYTLAVDHNDAEWLGGLRIQAGVDEDAGGILFHQSLEDEPLKVIFAADQGDQNADLWQLEAENKETRGVFSISSYITGAYQPIITFSSHLSSEDNKESTTTVSGELEVEGARVLLSSTTNLELDGGSLKINGAGSVGNQFALAADSSSHGWLTTSGNGNIYLAPGGTGDVFHHYLNAASQTKIFATTTTGQSLLIDSSYLTTGSGIFVGGPGGVGDSCTSNHATGGLIRAGYTGDSADSSCFSSDTNYGFHFSAYQGSNTVFKVAASGYVGVGVQPTPDEVLSQLTISSPDIDDIPATFRMVQQKGTSNHYEFRAHDHEYGDNDDYQLTIAYGEDTGVDTEGGPTMTSKYVFDGDNGFMSVGGVYAAVTDLENSLVLDGAIQLNADAATPIGEEDGAIKFETNEFFGYHSGNWHSLDQSAGSGTVNVGLQYKIPVYTADPSGSVVDHTSALYWKSDRLGVNEDDPQTDLHLKGAEGTTIRLERNEAADIVENDLIGAIEFYGFDAGLTYNTFGVGAKIVGMASGGWSHSSEHSSVDIQTELQFWTTPNLGELTKRLTIKDSGVIHHTKATYTTIEDAGTVGGETINLDLDDSDLHKITLDDDLTLTFSNSKEGQRILIRVLQSGGGGYTITWPGGITWVNGVVGQPTTTDDKATVFGFITTAADTYDGFVVGKNI